MTWISREGWGASPNRGSPVLIRPSAIYIHHAVDGGPCYDDGEASARVRAIQRMHQNVNGWTDAAYSAFVASNGTRLEGRRRLGGDWLTTKPGATKGYNDSLAICLLGNGSEGAWTDEARAATCGIIAEMRAIWGSIPIRAHRDVNATACPGDGPADWVHGGSVCDGSPHPPPPKPLPAPGDLDDRLQHWRPPETRSLGLDDAPRGDDVAEFQFTANLTVADPNTQGAEVKWTDVDGVFGPDTDRIARLVQSYGVALGMIPDGGVDGIAGPDTRHMVVATLNAKGIW